MAIKILQKTDPVTGYTFKNLHTDESAVSGESVQAVKFLLGAAGLNEGFLGSNNPLPVLSRLKYTTADPTYTNGATGEPRMNAQGHMLVSIATQQGGNDTYNQITATKTKAVNASQYECIIYETPAAGALSGVMKANQGSVQSLILENFNTSLGLWIHVHNTNGTPTATASRKISFYVPAATASGVPGRRTLTQDDFSGIIYCTLGVAFYASVSRTALDQTGLSAANVQVTAFLG